MRGPAKWVHDTSPLSGDKGIVPDLQSSGWLMRHDAYNVPVVDGRLLLPPHCRVTPIT